MKSFRWSLVGATRRGARSGSRSRTSRRLVPTLVALLALAPAVRAQQAGSSMHIGYVYPAGGQRGTTFEATIGGQFLAGLTNVYVSGGGVQAIITDLIRPISGGELNALRIKMDELLARRAVVKNDFKALEQFRSFKNAKDLKKDSAEGDKEIEELKKKYAGATWNADDEKLLMECRRKIGSGVRRPANPAISEIATVKLSIAPDAEPGRRELRVATRTGLSNPLVFEIGQLPEFSTEAHKEIAQQKSQVAKTAFLTKKTEKVDTTFTIPGIVNGQILPGGVNHHRFTAKKGQHLVIAVSARALIPYLADAVPGWFQATLGLFDANGKEVAYDDDFRFNPDPVLYYEIPADGEYRIEIKDSIYRGREDFVYRITVGELPFVTSIFPLGGPANAETTVELKGWNLPVTKLTLDDKNKTPGLDPVAVRKQDWLSNVMPFAVDTLPECLATAPNAAQRVTLPVIVNGRIAQPNDAAIFRFEGKAGQELVAEVMARRLNSPLDSVLKLTDAAGKQIAFNDDYDDKGAGLETHHADSYIRATLPADGTYYLNLRDTQSKGGPEYAYRLRLSAPRPDYALRIVPSSINARAGGTVPVTVYALRRDGFDGNIALALKNAPTGFKLSRAEVPAQTNLLKLTLSVPAGQQTQPVSLSLEGRATINGQEIVHPAVPSEDMMQAFEYRHLVPSQELDVAVAAGVSGGKSQPKSEAGRFVVEKVKAAAAAMKFATTGPVKIPAGGTTRVEVAMPDVPPYVRIQFELKDPPPGITVKNSWSSKQGMSIVLASDREKVKPGQTGNLVVSSYVQRADKSKAPAQRLPLTTLPALPFEIVQR